MAICMLSCSTVLAQQPSQFNALISDEAAIEQIQSLEWQAAGENLDPGQTVVAGVGSRHTSSYTLSASWEPDGEANLNWDLEIHYPFPSQWQYSETFNVSGDGKIEGADGFRPSPNNVIAPARAAARSKFLWMTFPALLLRQAQNFTPVNGKPGTYRFSALDTSWQVSIDATTGLPTTLATTENDPIFGLVQTSVSYLSWQETAGIIIPTRLEFRVDGDIIRRERIESVDLVTGTPKGQPDYTLARSEPMYERGWSMAHWFTRRISLGGPMDNDLTYPVEIQEIGNGVYRSGAVATTI